MATSEIEDDLEQLVSRAFVAESAARHRDPHHLGISALGRCTRKAAHQIAGTTPSHEVRPGEGRAANLGTWHHAGLLPRMESLIDHAKAEVDVKLHAAGITVTGHADLVVPGMVIDLKTVGEHRLQYVRRFGPPSEHVMQVAAYGVALLQAGASVSQLSLIYMDRANGDLETFVIPFTNRLAMTVIQRITDLAKLAKDPDSAPREDVSGTLLQGPGFGFHCNECPWIKRCWGAEAEPFERQPRTYSDQAMESLLEEYDRARAVESEARQRKGEILGLLGDASHGEYGTYRYGRDRDTRIDDGAAAIRVLHELGVPVPQTWRRGATRIRLAKKKTRKNK